MDSEMDVYDACGLEHWESMNRRDKVPSIDKQLASFRDGTSNTITTQAFADLIHRKAQRIVDRVVAEAMENVRKSLKNA